MLKCACCLVVYELIVKSGVYACMFIMQTESREKYIRVPTLPRILESP